MGGSGIFDHSIHFQEMEMLADGIFSMLERIFPENRFFGMHPGDPGRIGFRFDRLRFRP